MKSEEEIREKLKSLRKMREYIENQIAAIESVLEDSDNGVDTDD